MAAYNSSVSSSFDVKSSVHHIGMQLWRIAVLETACGTDLQTRRHPKKGQASSIEQINAAVVGKKKSKANIFGIPKKVKFTEPSLLL